MFNAARSSTQKSHGQILFSVLSLCTFINHSFSLTEKAINSVDFHSCVCNGLYVDKSLFISDMLARDEKVFQITRPRRWGKTMNLKLLETFFDVEFDENGKPLPETKRDNSILFKGGNINFSRGKKILAPLEISGVKTAMEVMGKHPVIYLSLAGVKGKSLNEIAGKLKESIVKLYRSFPFFVKYLDNETTILDEDEIPRLENFLRGHLEKEYIFDSLEFLSMMLFEHFNSYVCLLIDDYDLPLINAFLTFGQSSEFEFVVEMFRKLYEYSFKENQYLLKGVVTGTLNFDVVPNGIGEFDYNYIMYDSVFNQPFMKYFGFSEEEVGKLIQNVHQMEGLKDWYGGFFVNGTEIYNPGSVVTFFQKQEFNYFLLQNPSDLVDFANGGYLSPQFKEILLLCGESKERIIDKFSSTVSLQNVAEDFFSIFVSMGYLNLITPKRYAREEILRVKIPNLETKGIFAGGFQVWIAKELNITLGECTTLSNFLLLKKVDKFAEKLETFLLHSKLFNTDTDEERYHNLMAAIIASFAVGNEVSTIREVGSYRGESVIIPLRHFGNVVIHLEYNICKSLQNVQNIIEESLLSLLQRPASCTEKHRKRDHVEKILYVAVGFLGHKVSVRSKLVNNTRE